MARGTWLALLLGCELASGCQGACGQAGRAGDAGATGAWDQAPHRDAQAWDGAPDRQGLPDGSGLPQGVPGRQQRDYCDEAVIRFDVSSWQEYWLEPISRKWAVVQWSDDLSWRPHMEVLNLETCMAYQVVPEWWPLTARDPHEDVAGDILVVTGTQVSEQELKNTDDDTYVLDLGTWEVQQITDTPDDFEELPVTNGRYVAFHANHFTGQGGPPDDGGLWLVDLETGEASVVGDRGSGGLYCDISDRYLVWSAYTKDPASQGKDVFYLDLQTMERHRVEATVRGYQYSVSTDGDWITWVESDSWIEPPYRVVAYRISTQERYVVSEGELTPIWSQVSRGVVDYRTYAYVLEEGTQWPEARDIVLYEPLTGVRRRLTTKAMPVSGALRSFASPWYGYSVGIEGEGPPCHMMYLVNLEKLGVVDSEGHLIPGGPVFDVPCR